MDFTAYFFFAGGLVTASVLLAACAAAGWLLHGSVSLWTIALPGGVIMAIGVLGIAMRFRQFRRNMLGLRGELITAEWLSELESMGYRVFHDLPSERGNIDHVAVGPAGVFVIETKWRSRKSSDRIEYDGRTLRVGGHDQTGRLLGQCRACRDEVRRRLRDYAPGAEELPVRAVLVFPNWPVQEASGAEVWVLNPKRRVAAWIRQEEKRTTAQPAAIAMATAMFDHWARL